MISIVIVRGDISHVYVFNSTGFTNFSIMTKQENSNPAC